MKPSSPPSGDGRREQAMALLLLGVAVAFVFAGTSFELWYPTAHMSDLTFHLSVLMSLEHSWQSSGSLFDFWYDTSPFGYPLFRTYQHLPHLFLFLIYHLTPQSINYESVLRCSTIFALCAVPLSAWWTTAILRFPPYARAAAALASVVIVEAADYGLGLHNYTWGSSGIVTQLWAALFLLPAFAFCMRYVLESGRIFPAILLCFLTCGSHLVAAIILGGSVAITCLAGFFTCRAPTERREIAVRTARLGCLVLAATSYQWVFIILDRQWLHQSIHEPQWKFASHGTQWVVDNFWNGDIFDFGRFPSVSLLVLAGFWSAIFLPRNGHQGDSRSPVCWSVLPLLFLAWITALCGWDLWGWAIKNMPVISSMHLHRLIIGVHAFGLLLVACAAVALQHFVRNDLVRMAILVFLFIPPFVDRWDRYTRTRAWLDEALYAQRADTGLQPLLKTLKGLPRGYAFVGMEQDWARELPIGQNLRLRHITLGEGIPTLGQLFHAYSLACDMLFYFSPQREAHQRWFGARYTIAPKRWKPPPFLNAVATFGQYSLYSFPSLRMVEIARVQFAVSQDLPSAKKSGLISQWIASPLPDKNIVGTIGPGPAQVVAAAPDSFAQLAEQLAHNASAIAPGTVTEESAWEPGLLSARVTMHEPGLAVLKSGFHPNWQVTVDGKPSAILHVTPGYVAVQLDPGSHEVVFRYSAGALRPALFWGAVVMMGLLALRRGAK